MWRLNIAVVSLSALGVVSGASAAEKIDGEWARDDGAIRTQIGPCEGNICATNSWARNPQGKVGDKLVMTLRETDGKRWKGTAFDPQRNRSYSMELNVSGNTMTTRGCVLSGILCRNVGWTRFGS